MQSIKRSFISVFILIIFFTLTTPVGAILGVDWILATNSADWSGRYDLTSAVFDNKLWVMGGFDSGANVLNDVWYTTDGFNWTEATSNADWSGRASVSAVFDSKLWIMGGFNGVIMLNDVWYTTDGVNWTEATSNADWSARSNSTSAVFDNKLWVMGGFDNDLNVLNDVWYTTDGVNWTEATSNADWSGRYDPTSAVFDNKLWIIGGSDVGMNALNDVWYTTDGINWTEATSDSDADLSYHSGAVSAVLNNRLWVMGGSDAGFNAINDVWYTTDGVNWTEATNDADWFDRSLLTSAVFDNKLWIIGGFNGTVGLNDVWYSSIPLTAPSSPSNLSVIAGEGRMDLSWDTPDDDGGSVITGYKIYRDTLSPSVTLIDTIGASSTYEDTSVSNGTEYFYRVKAVNAIGDSDFSNEDSATSPKNNSGSRLAASASKVAVTTVAQTPAVVANDCLPLYNFSSVTGQPCPKSTSSPTGTPPSVFTPSASISAVCTVLSTLRQGSRGAEVTCLQTLLKITPTDGIFGPQTRQAVVDFQKSKNLIPDGIVGPQTRGAIRES